ncbi:hypothetical protein PFISCL1PPCAC_12301, partial [Pristionchus fissidentatus]
LQDFKNLLKILFGLRDRSLTDDAVEMFLQLAERFDLKIVEDRVVNFLLGCDSISIHKKLLMSEQLRLETLKV